MLELVTKRPELLELVEFVDVDVDVETDVETEDEVEFVVGVTVTVEVTWTVVVETLAFAPPEPLGEFPTGAGSSGAAPEGAGALPPKACVATKTDPAPAITTRTSTEATDNF